MIDPVVRPASSDDAPQLRRLEQRARTALADRRGGQRWLATHAERGDSWRDTIEQKYVFVATIDSVVIGYLVASTRDTVLSIDDVFVHDEARELGFGDELLRAAIESGRTAGLRLLEGEALPGDRSAKNLYERAGIKARLITVSTEL
jgi:ribosomal protein S18 acetylase RimI-like enzyme